MNGYWSYIRLNVAFSGFLIINITFIILLYSLFLDDYFLSGFFFLPYIMVFELLSGWVLGSLFFFLMKRNVFRVYSRAVILKKFALSAVLNFCFAIISFKLFFNAEWDDNFVIIVAYLGLASALVSTLTDGFISRAVKKKYEAESSVSAA